MDTAGATHRSEVAPMSDRHLVCQCHGSQFDVTTGTILRDPATEPLATYEARAGRRDLQIRV
jgi:3-phenylpropionate/trans-cinnamate dioxygenase ferredoxin component